jgi:predicted TIM-barrel fold metal-dependent hydrolase
LIDKIGGNFDRDLEKRKKALSADALRLIKEAYDGTIPQKLADYHVHIVGMNTEKTGCLVNKKMLNQLNLKENVRYRLFVSALGIEHMENADQEALERLVQLIRKDKLSGIFYILALDKHYNKDGTSNPEKTEFYVPNEYVYKIYETHPDIFLPVVSIHPYRKDAIAELEKWAGKGVKMVKWIPNAQGMNPADPDIIPFYRRMKELKMVLLSHGGEENAVDAKENQKLGNPLLMRLPLDMGVKVIIAHGASLGKNIDLDSPKRKMVNNFDLFLRLMDEKKYDGLVFGDISAQLQFNRLSKPLKRILERPDLHQRLVNGSDYPLPAMNMVIMTSKLSLLGYITSHERKCLNEIYHFNPLLFDFVLKRTVKHPKTKRGFSTTVFQDNRFLEYSSTFK